MKYLKKLKLKFIELLSAELSIHKIALSFAIGIVLGTIPFFLGVNIYLSIFFAWRLKLNHVLVQLITNVVYPLQLLLFIPFIKYGTLLLSNDEIYFSTSYILALFKENTLGAIVVLGAWNIYGLLLWIITSLISIPVLYIISKTLIKKLKFIPQPINSFR
ncbi:DUF2062 domain-containing protein [Plebeiibacterium sediminum]|uniref:DUF2062 domain-containing protein n=1 Tax=Plebeiibacterium sediminum TaxID=2992112 RepID=A0AAE3M6K2_9BACT|nr:DUF2062 domain-containing protein [Plebeiobacterium sediminum]MCW3788231.1 DUF2062 domain-containing protein [Plebeiobacterium sediminum]